MKLPEGFKWPERLWSVPEFGPIQEYEFALTFDRVPTYAIYYTKSGKFPKRVHYSNVGNSYKLTEVQAYRVKVGMLERLLEHTKKILNEIEGSS